MLNRAHHSPHLVYLKKLGAFAVALMLQVVDPGDADVVVGADIVYVQEAVPLLLATAATLLSDSGDARLVLCHTSRRVSEDRIVSAALAAGFEPQPWSAAVSQAAEAAGIARHGHMRLLVFRRQQNAA